MKQVSRDEVNGNTGKTNKYLYFLFLYLSHSPFVSHAMTKKFFFSILYSVGRIFFDIVVGFRLNAFIQSFFTDFYTPFMYVLN